MTIHRMFNSKMAVSSWKFRLLFAFVLITILTFLFQASVLDRGEVANSVMTVSWRTEAGRWMAGLKSNGLSSHSPHKRGTINFYSKFAKCEHLLSVSDSGRFGNQVSQYATLYIHARRLEVVPVISKKMANFIRPMFPKISIKTKEELNCTTANFTHTKLLHVVRASSAKVLFSNASNVNIAGFPNDMERYKMYKAELLDEFTFDKGVLRCARLFLHNLKLQHRNSTGTEKDILFVGVHVRRTDYSHYLAKTQNAKLVTGGYFARAMDKFRERFSDSEVVFVVASDDMKWCRRWLGKIKNVYFTSVHKSCGITMARFDFALLANCQHSIMTYGTYGFWISYLAPGSVIAAAGMADHPLRINKLVHRGGILDNWSDLEDPCLVKSNETLRKKYCDKIIV